jgi:hypothetical protein
MARHRQPFFVPINMLTMKLRIYQKKMQTVMNTCFEVLHDMNFEIQYYCTKQGIINAQAIDANLEISRLLDIKLKDCKYGTELFVLGGMMELSYTLVTADCKNEHQFIKLISQFYTPSHATIMNYSTKNVLF